MRFSSHLPVHEQHDVNRNTGRNWWRLPLMLAWLQYPQSSRRSVCRCVGSCSRCRLLSLSLDSRWENDHSWQRESCSSTPLKECRFHPRGANQDGRLYETVTTVSTLSLNTVCVLPVKHRVFGELKDNLTDGERCTAFFFIWCLWDQISKSKESPDVFHTFKKENKKKQKNLWKDMLI